MSNYDIESEISRYIQQLHSDNSEDAFFALLHLDDKYLPDLMNAYHQRSDLAIKAALVEVIWQHRQPHTLPFLAEALHQQHEGIWKNALDGIVTIGGTDSLNLLETERNRLIANPLPTQNRLEWIDEAIGQIKSTLD
jgi:hypothetical protein